MIHYFWKLFLRLKYPTCKIYANRIGKNIKLENNVTLELGCQINSPKIGKYTFLNKFTIVDSNVTEIGRFCSIAYNVKLGLGNHPSNWISTHPFAYSKKYGFVSNDLDFDEDIKKPCIIGNDVWIGANATVLAGVTIGDGAIIGANALVTKDVAPYSIVVGIPAKEVRKRFDEETIEQLVKLKWWDWDNEKIKDKIDAFDQPHKLVQVE